MRPRRPEREALAAAPGRAGGEPAGRRRAPWVPFALAAVVLLTYWPLSGYDYVWDDLYVHLHANPMVTDFGWEALLRLFAEPWLGLYVPLTYATWGAAWQLFPAEQLPGALHLLNLLLHLGNSLLVLAIVRRLAPNAGPLPVLLGALVFAIHPVQVETVAWISELRALGAAFFGLAAIWLALRGAATARFWRLALLLALLTAVANLFKPAAVVVPPAAFLLLWGFGLVGWRRALLLLAPALAVGVGLALFNAIVQTGVGKVPDTDLLERVRIAAFSLLHYLGSILWPFELSPLYGVNQDSAEGRWLYDNALGLLSLVGVATAAICRLKLRRWCLVALFLLGLAPVSGLIPFAFQILAYVADRYLYWSMLAVALIVALSLEALAARLPVDGIVRPLAAGGAILLLLFGAFVTHFHQLPLWRDEPTFWREVIAREGPLVPATNNLGRALRRLDDPAGALDAYAMSLERAPEDLAALYGTAVAAIDLGDEALAEATFRRIMEVSPQHAAASLQLADIEIRRGNFVAAIEWLNISVPALRASPDPRQRANLARAYYLRVLALVNLKRDELVLREAEKALAVEPDYGEVMLLRAVSLARLGRPEEALADLRRVLALGLSLDPIRHLEVMQPLIAEVEGG